MWAFLARKILRLGGWTITSGAPGVPKAVIIAVPHTSNWDGLWALTYIVAIGLKVKFFAKRSLFWFPLGNLLRLLGGVPLDRRQAGSAVDQALALFDESESVYFGLAPEGTRANAPIWKSGFYRIAVAADVPVIPGFLDYGTRSIGLGEPITLSGDQDADLEIFRALYTDVVGRHPEKAGKITFQ
jgi:1-acyl-sn-glycerol-3-phosphate acyltransferase